MKIGSSEIILIVLLMVFLVFSSYFLVDARLQGRTVSVNFSKGINTAVKILNGSNSQNITTTSVINLVTTTISKSVTTTTVRIMFFNTNGVPTAAVVSVNGNVLLNCGSDVDVVNKLFINNVPNLNAVIITSMSQDHIAGCARLLMLMPPAFVMDAGQSIPSDNYSNYLLATGDKRKALEEGMAFATGKLQGNVLYAINDTYGMGFRLGNLTFVYADGCNDDCLDKILPRNVTVLMLVNGGTLTEDRMSKLLPKVVVMYNAGQDAVSVAKKYGIVLYDVNKTGDVVLIWDGKKFIDN